jgi:branched-chain amino acid transport system substrate-binding protein
MKKVIIWVVLLGIVVIILVGLNGKDNGVIKVGVLTPLSGPIAIAGEVQKNALAMAQKDNPNAKIELVYEDSKYDPKTSLSGYEALKLQGVKIIIADGSPVVAAIREKAVQDGVLVFAQSATTPAFTDDSPFTCRIGLTADVLGPSMSEYVKNNLKYNNIALLTANNEYGATMKDEITKSFNSLGGKVVVSESYDQASGDLRSNILKIVQKQNEIDALLLTNNITPEPMFKQLKELGWTKPIISDAWTLTSPNMKDRTVASGVPFIDYAYTPQAELNTIDGAVNYANRYKTEFNNSSPILLGALTYDSYNILSQAINEVGGDPKKVSKYLVDMPEFKGITGNIDFDVSCQNINKKLVWRKVKTDGSFENI